MIKKLMKKFGHAVRRFLGVEQALETLRQQQELLRKALKSHQHQLDSATSYLEFATIDDARMRASSTFQNFHEIIALLTPMDVSGAQYRRVGKNFDGGYVMLNDAALRNVAAAYSFGIARDVSWDEEIAGLGIDIYMYDHTIEKLPKQNPRFRYFKEGVTGDPEEEGLETLSNLIRRNGHEESENLILKMDIEGHEWSVFAETPSAVIGQFVQIVIELHGLVPSRSTAELSRSLSVLKKINQTHQSVHVHANGYCPISWFGGQALPNVLEVTYVRRADYAGRLAPNTRTFPTEIDQPTFPWLPDVNLGTFASAEKGTRTNEV
jgi:hypothetical protein